jgi:pimeloyl-ACP methyl ester carboxylesterase
MVDDTQAAVSALSSLDVIDAKTVFLAGYSLGGKVALFTAALDDRVAGVIAASAFTPWRTPRPATEGIQHYTGLHALIPRLKQFEGNEREIPVDYDEIIGAIAPRPLYIRTPKLDRYASLEDVRRAVESARESWKVRDAADRLTFVTPLDFNRFRIDAQREAFTWLAGLQ